eukprot:2416328-Amphidinium_carterae.2
MTPKKPSAFGWQDQCGHCCIRGGHCDAGEPGAKGRESLRWFGVLDSAHAEKAPTAGAKKHPSKSASATEAKPAGTKTQPTARELSAVMAMLKRCAC